MARRHIHYEAAFEDYLIANGVAHVAIDEAKKAAFADARIKSFDFLVYPDPGPNLIVDIKGRKVAVPNDGRSCRWENWVTHEDLQGLQRWERVFGDGFSAQLIFAYWLTGPDECVTVPVDHSFRSRKYTFWAVPVEQYLAHARPRSSRWSTVAMPTEKFRLHARPVEAVLLGR